MNSTYQVFLSLLIVLLAVLYLVWVVRKSRSSGKCGGGCDCHHPRETPKRKKTSQ